MTQTEVARRHAAILIVFGCSAQFLIAESIHGQRFDVPHRMIRLTSVQWKIANHCNCWQYLSIGCCSTCRRPNIIFVSKIRKFVIQMNSRRFS